MQTFLAARSFLIALQFLTRVPTPAMAAPTPLELSRAALYYPLVGLLIGALMLVTARLLANQDPLLVAALLLGMWVILTGALHLDGLADSADAWLGGQDNPDRTHEILKDPLVGTAGVVAIFIILLFKYIGLYALLKQHNYIVVLLAPVLGRGFILLLFTTTNYVRKHGLASDMVAGLNGRAALLGLLFVMLISLWYAPLAVLVIVLTFIALRKLMIQRLGGCTGDTAGATVEITEALWLFFAALF